MNQGDEEELQSILQENKFQKFLKWFQGQGLFAKLSLLFLAIVTIATPTFIVGRHILGSHASTGQPTTCIQPPPCINQGNCPNIAHTPDVTWCTTQSTITSVAALGDSITAGFTNCLSTASPATCPLEPNNYVSLYAASVLPAGSKYSNFGYAGTTAACAGTCPAADTINQDPNAFKNSYVQNWVALPANEASIQVQSNMVARNAPGIVRANLGEFDTLSNAEIIVAWGRNDVDTASITIQQYHDAIATIVAHGKNNPSNHVILLTISPLDKTGWANTVPPSSRRTEFNDRIFDFSYPRELDAFFSAQEWEVAYAAHASLAPLGEYLWQNLPSTYLSSDHLHPSTDGYQLIAKVLEEQTGQVIKNVVSLEPNVKFAITAQVPTYGEIVSQKNGDFYYAEPFYADAHTPYIAKTITDDTVVYANRAVSIGTSISQDTEVPEFKISGLVVDSMTAYGKGWNWHVNGLPWAGNGFDLTAIPRFANGPCVGKSVGSCKFDTRAEFLINGQEIESITAYGKYWNFDLQGNPWQSNGSDLTTVARYSAGPCLGKIAGSCVFTSRQQILLPNGHFEEEVVAYGQKWDWDENGNVLSPTSNAAFPSVEYTNIVNCYGVEDNQPTALCQHPELVDLNHDGVVNGVDLNMFFRSQKQ